MSTPDVKLGTFIITDTVISAWDTETLALQLVCEATDEFGRSGTVAFALPVEEAKEFTRRLFLATKEFRAWMDSLPD